MAPSVQPQMNWRKVRSSRVLGGSGAGDVDYCGTDNSALAADKSWLRHPSATRAGPVLQWARTNTADRLCEARRL